MISRLLGFCIILCVATSASAQSRLCAKNSATVQNGKINLSDLLVSHTSACPAGTKSVFMSDTPAQILKKLQTVDGAGSSLDADTLDGATKNDFAQASALNTVKATVTDLTASSSNHETRLSALEDETRVNSVVRVATSGGDYSSLSTAISSLSSPSASNPYLVIVGPGTFTLSSTVTIPNGVTVQGSGIDRTIIASSRNSGSVSDSAVLILSEGSAIESLTVENTSAANSLACTGVFIEATSVSNKNNIANFNPVIKDVRVKLRKTGAASHYGVYAGGDALITRSIIDVEGSSSSNVALTLFTGETHSLHVQDSSLYAGSGSTSIGISVSHLATGKPSLLAKNIHVYGEKKAVSVGASSARATILNSTLTTNPASGTGISVTKGTAIVNNSTIDAFDNAYNGGGTISCSFITELNGGRYTSTCE